MFSISKSISRLLTFAGFSLLILSIVNCSGVAFSGKASAINNAAGDTPGSGNATTSNGGTCALTNVSVPVKVLFVVDRSGSNAVATQDDGTTGCTDPNLVGCAPATDPNKTFRGGSISAFFDENQSNTSFSWGFLAFSGTSAQPYVTSGSQAAFGNASAMQSALATFYAGSDQNATPYLAALSSANSAISSDPGLHFTGTQAPLYEIIFLSDGYPTDALNNDGSVNLASLTNAVSSISALAPGRVFLSSVYYGTINDPTAAHVLQSMSQTGGGQFVNADTGTASSISINNLITVPSTDCAGSTPN